MLHHDPTTIAGGRNIVHGFIDAPERIRDSPRSGH